MLPLGTDLPEALHLSEPAVLGTDEGQTLTHPCRWEISTPLWERALAAGGMVAAHLISHYSDPTRMVLLSSGLWSWDGLSLGSQRFWNRQHVEQAHTFRGGVRCWLLAGIHWKKSTIN